MKARLRSLSWQNFFVVLKTHFIHEYSIMFKLHKLEKFFQIKLIQFQQITRNSMFFDK